MKKILIIDDDSTIRDVIKAVLHSNYEIKEASNKKEGLTIANSFIPDLIIMDVMMESITSGFEAAREIKKNKKFKNTKILMLTNVDKETKIDFKSEAGDDMWLPVDEYMVKPVDPKTLILKVQNLI
jgi:CheY-like chemotaxis protein